MCIVFSGVASGFCFADAERSAAADSARPTFDLQTLAAPPAVYPAEGFNAPGVRALFYEGELYQGRPTRVFAYYGVPKVPAGQKVPAIVLVHGGGGTAFDRWVRVWTERGYAAIAMDHCGNVPIGKDSNWTRHEHGGPPGCNASFPQSGAGVADQWQYHAISAIVRAHSLLRSFPEVDADRIGLTGISWGGYLTCLTVGVDTRFQFAAPVYGCGFLGDNSAWLPQFEELGKKQSTRWLSLWDPSHYLPQAKLPMLWVNGTNDFAYPMDSWQKSYRLPKGPRTLCLRVRMPHGHGPAGENPEEIRAFADSILKKGPPLPKILKQSREGKVVRAAYECVRPLSAAELCFTRDRGKWQDRHWESIPAEIDAAQKQVQATLPDGVSVYYLNIFDGKELAVSTEHAELAP